VGKKLKFGKPEKKKKNRAFKIMALSQRDRAHPSGEKASLSGAEEKEKKKGCQIRRVKAPPKIQNEKNGGVETEGTPQPWWAHERAAGKGK